MEKQTVLVTGAMGEVGHGLIHALHSQGEYDIVGFDHSVKYSPLASECTRFYEGDILDPNILADIQANHTFDMIFHLAAILSTGGERAPLRTHNVNVQGSINILELARRQTEARNLSVRVIFPSTISIYGIPNLEEKNRGKVKEEEYLHPITMYGANKIYVEHVGKYYSSYFRLLDENRGVPRIDFRCVRFPGVISAETLPTGGTSDFAPEMLHAAAQGKPYECFVRPDSRIPFIVMPDAVKCLIQLAHAQRSRLLRSVYNIGAFAPSAAELEAKVQEYFPSAVVSYKPHPQRQRIIDSWPASVDDSLARAEWGWSNDYNFDRAFQEYLIPGIIKKYPNCQPQMKVCVNQ